MTPPMERLLGRGVTRTHDCADALQAPSSQPCLHPCCAGYFLGTSRTSVARFVAEEGLPAEIILVGPRGRQTLRFRREEIEKWLKERRERQIRGTLTGERFTRRGDAQ